MATNVTARLRIMGFQIIILINFSYHIKIILNCNYENKILEPTTIIKTRDPTSLKYRNHVFFTEEISSFNIPKRKWDNTETSPKEIWKYHVDGIHVYQNRKQQQTVDEGRFLGNILKKDSALVN